MTEEEKIKMLRNALIGVVGTEDKEELLTIIKNAESSNQSLEERCIAMNACYAIIETA